MRTNGEKIKDKLLELLNKEEIKNLLTVEDAEALMHVFENRHPFAVATNLITVIMAEDEVFFSRIISEICDINKVSMQIAVTSLEEAESPSDKVH